MEFGARSEGEMGNEPHEHRGYNNEGERPFTGRDGETASEPTSLLPTDASALRQSPDWSAGDEQDPAADRFVHEVLEEGGEIYRLRDDKARRAEVLSNRIEDLEGQVNQLTREAEASATQFEVLFGDARVVMWRRMDKDARGYAHGEANMRRVVDLSPEPFCPDPNDQRVTREQLAVQANSEVKAGESTVMTYETGGRRHYQGGVPAADGFAIGIEEAGERRFMFGINEPVAFAEESWPIRLTREGNASGRPEPAVRSNVHVCSGEQEVKGYLRDVAENTAVILDSVAMAFYAEDSAVATDQFQSLLRQRAAARQQLIEVGLAANVLGLNAATEGWSHATRERMAETFRDRLLDEINTAAEGDTAYMQIAHAMRPLFIEGDAGTGTLADYLIHGSQTRPVGLNDSRAGVLKVLTDVCGMDPEIAERRLYVY